MAKIGTALVAFTVISPHALVTSKTRSSSSGIHRPTTTHWNVRQLARSLKLARNVVAVPCGQKLHIEMHLNIETSKNQGVGNNTHFNITLSFGNDIRSQRHKVDDGDEVEVNVRRLVPIL